MFDKCSCCKYSEDIGYDYSVYNCRLKSCIYDEDEKEQTSKSNKVMDEEELDKLAEESWNDIRKFPYNARNNYICGFKAGYHKAKEE